MNAFLNHSHRSRLGDTYWLEIKKINLIFPINWKIDSRRKDNILLTEEWHRGFNQLGVWFLYFIDLLVRAMQIFYEIEVFTRLIACNLSLILILQYWCSRGILIIQQYFFNCINYNWLLLKTVNIKKKRYYTIFTSEVCWFFFYIFADFTLFLAIFVATRLMPQTILVISMKKYLPQKTLETFRNY